MDFNGSCIELIYERDEFRPVFRLTKDSNAYCILSERRDDYVICIALKSYNFPTMVLTLYFPVSAPDTVASYSTPSLIPSFHLSTSVALSSTFPPPSSPPPHPHPSLLPPPSPNQGSLFPIISSSPISVTSQYQCPPLTPLASRVFPLPTQDHPSPPS